jgi:hypothetical protein
MDPDYSQRDSAPEGCNDLNDVLERVDQTKRKSGVIMPKNRALPVPHLLTVRDLAALVKRKPFQIIADLLALGVFAKVDQQIDSAIVSRVLKKYGSGTKNLA